MNEAKLTRQVAILRSYTDKPYFEQLLSTVKSVADSVTCFSFGTAPEQVLDADRFGLVVLMGMEEYPSGLKAQIKNYMSKGGRVLLVGGPAFGKELHLIDGTWATRDAALAETLAGVDFANAEKKCFFDASDEDFVAQMRSNPYNKDHGTRWSVSENAPDGEGALRVDIGRLECWNTFSSPIDFSYEGADAIALYAKAGDNHTPLVGLQIMDDEGAKWFTRLPLTQDWELRVVPDYEFILYKDSRSTRRTPDLSRIKEIAFGYTYDWLSAEPIDHSYLLGDIYACRMKLPYVPQNEPEMRLDGVSPMWELYPLTNATTIAAHPNQVVVKERDYVLPANTYSCYPHRQGLGYNNNRLRRFIPLIEVKDEKGLHSGYAAWINLFCSAENANGALEGSIFACFSVSSDDFYDENGMAAIRETLQALMRDYFMIEGGVDEFTYIVPDNEKATAGVSHIALRGVDANAVTSTVSLYEGDRLLKTFESKDYGYRTVSGGISTFSDTLDFTQGRPTRAVATLMLDGEVIDRIEHDIHYWQPKPLSERKYVYTEDGYFKRDGKILTLYGINYGPSYRAGISSTGWWLGGGDYEPEIIENDLERMRDIGFNALSIWGAGVEQANLGNSMVDLLRRCEEKGFYVDMALAHHAYPMKDFDADKMEYVIKKWHLDEMDFLVAYDIAWEFRVGNYVGKWWDFQPDSMIGTYVGRKWLEADFTEWVNTYYGSLERAQRIWGCTLELTPEGNPYVSDAMLDDQTGKYDQMLAAYYRFLDDAFAKYMNVGMKELRRITPHQMYSFRMSMSGSGMRTALFQPSTHCFDFQSLAPVLDFMSPEGYELGATGDRALQVPIANAYARYTTPNAPVVWKEYGLSSWSGKDDSNFRPSEKAQNGVANTVDAVYGHMFHAYTSAVYYWWSSTGYRIDERGDCGAWNPDGSDRPLTAVLRKYAPIFIGQGERKSADVTIRVEREDQSGAIYGIYEAVYDQAKEAFLSGKTIDFVDGTQKSFAQMPYADEVYRASVDGVANEGTYPLRYVNGMVKNVETVEKDGKTVALVTVCNTKQSVWRAGSVSLISCPTSDVEVNVTIDQDVAYLENVTLEVPLNCKGKLALRFEIKGVAFGPLYSTEIE